MASSPPDSPLSSVGLSDEDIPDDLLPTPAHADMAMPRSKRRKTMPAGPSFGSFGAHDPNAMHPSHPHPDSDLDLSEDTEGSAPGSPSHDEFAMSSDQVTVCQWEGCTTGELRNSDDLVRHVHDEHIIPKRARYTCEWGDCARKGTAHPSGYALKAHMRSHTKEKPFFCHLPGMCRRPLLVRSSDVC